MTRAKRDLFETIIITCIVMAYVVLIFWIRRARVLVLPLILFSTVTIFLGAIALICADKKVRRKSAHNRNRRNIQR